MRFKLRSDGRPTEWALYEVSSWRRICGIYLHPESDYTNLIWWGKDEELPGRIDTADFDAVRMLAIQIAESTGEWK